jgi:hypothetical protein
MKRVYALGLVFLAALFMQGCATHANFIKRHDAWVGKDIREFIRTAGYPDSTYVLVNKNTVYVYERSRVYSVPSMHMPMYMAGGYGYGGYYGGGYGMFGYGNNVVQETCKLYLEVDQKSIIVRWGSRGNNCRSN